MFSAIQRWGEFIKISHTIFAMPFGLAAMFLAAGGWPKGKIFAGVLICLVGARTAAMAFNRMVDWRMDMRNPRTAGRAGLVSKAVGWGTMVGGVGLLVGGAWVLNPLCLVLSPVALGIVCFYSLTKRFTWASHGFLGVEAFWGRQPEKRQRAFFEANAMVSGLVLAGVAWEIFGR